MSDAPSGLVSGPLLDRTPFGNRAYDVTDVDASCGSPQIWLMALCVTCVFLVTLSVFPVITVRVQTVYKDNAAWGETPSSSLSRQNKAPAPG